MLMIEENNFCLMKLRVQIGKRGPGVPRDQGDKSQKAPD